MTRFQDRGAEILTASLPSPFQTTCKLTHHIVGSLVDGYRELCTLKADLSGLERSLRSRTGLRGKQYWRVDFEVEVFFGQTSLCANLIWVEDVRALARRMS